MKKIIALFVIMLACGVSANAQQKKNVASATPAVTAQQGNDVNASIRSAAIKDVENLSEFVQLTPEQKTGFKGLFEYKQNLLQKENLSAERKAVLAQAIEAKIKASLTPDQVAKLEDNPKLLQMLVN
jgi:hypothetical protein